MHLTETHSVLLLLFASFKYTNTQANAFVYLLFLLCAFTLCLYLTRSYVSQVLFGCSIQRFNYCFFKLQFGATFNSCHVSAYMILML